VSGKTGCSLNFTNEIMKYIIISIVALLYLPATAQPENLYYKTSDIESFIAKVYTANDFKVLADSLQLSIFELSDYPIIFPVKKPVISSGFGMRLHPIYKVRKFHRGIDLPKAPGTPVYSTGSGVVIRKGYNSGYGNYIEIKHAGDFRSFYAHLSKTLVNIGDTVRITQQIACVGKTGLATGSHLHYEVRKGKRFLNPSEWCYCLFELMKDNLKEIEA